MAYWLLKTEPDDWSWDEQVARGAKGEAWSGVRNAQARNFMRAMKKGDLAFFYHTGKERRIVGVVKVSRAAYPDREATGDWSLVDVVAVEPCPEPVTLAAVREEPALKEMMLLRNSRLSVQPVSDDEWPRIRAMAGFAKP